MSYFVYFLTNRREPFLQKEEGFERKAGKSQ